MIGCQPGRPPSRHRYGQRDGEELAAGRGRHTSADFASGEWAAPQRLIMGGARFGVALARFRSGRRRSCRPDRGGCAPRSPGHVLFAPGQAIDRHEQRREPGRMSRLDDHGDTVGVILVAGGGLPETRERQQIAGTATQLWGLDRSYLADPQRILQARDTAPVLGGHAINVARRSDNGCGDTPSHSSASARLVHSGRLTCSHSQVPGVTFSRRGPAVAGRPSLGTLGSTGRRGDGMRSSRFRGRPTPEAGREQVSVVRRWWSWVTCGLLV